MLAKTKQNKGSNDTFDAGIDYQYYDNRARNLRSEAAWGWLKGLFTEQHFSLIKIRNSVFDQVESMLDSIRCRLRPCPQV